MTRSAFFALGLGLAALASGPGFAQQRSGVAHVGPHGLNPNTSLSSPTTTPLQAQIEDDYASQLRGQQRDLLQQNPSGVSRQELEIGHELNGFTPH
jgi:hypothetical protein